MFLRQIAIGTMANFSYIIANESQRIGAVIDPGWPGNGLKAILKEARCCDISIKYILLTHSHYDHSGGVRELQKITGARLVAANSSLSPDIAVRDGDTLDLGGLKIQVIHTPGHSPDSILFLAGDSLFTGDTLFVGGCGRADLAGSNPQELFVSLREKIALMPPDTKVYPGHDYGPLPVSTIGRELKENPYLKCRSPESFLKLRLG